MIHLAWSCLNHPNPRPHSSGFIRPALARTGARPPGSELWLRPLLAGGRAASAEAAATVLQPFGSQSIPEGWLRGTCTLHLPELQFPLLENEHNNSTRVIGLSWQPTQQGLAHICTVGMPTIKIIISHTHGPPCCQFFLLVGPLAHPALLGNL